MKYNSQLANLYFTGLFETYCFINQTGGAVYTSVFDFKKDNQPQKQFKLIMENL